MQNKVLAGIGMIAILNVFVIQMLPCHCIAGNLPKKPVPGISNGLTLTDLIGGTPQMLLYINSVMGKTVVIHKLPTNFRCVSAYAHPVGGNLMIFSDQRDDLTITILSLTNAGLSKFRAYDEATLFKRFFNTGAGGSVEIPGKYVMTLFPPCIDSATSRGIISVGKEDMHYFIGSSFRTNSDKPGVRESIQSMSGYIFPKANQDKLIYIRGYGNPKDKAYNLATTKKFLQSIANFPR